MSTTVARENRAAMVMCHPNIPDDDDAQIRMDWLRRFIPNQNIEHWCRPELGMNDSWNEAMRYVLTLPKNIEEVLFIHDDVIPDERSDRIWDRNDDIVCCRFDADAPWIWSCRESFHNAMFRVKRKVIEVVPDPWWDEVRHWDEGVNNRVGCMCTYFSRAARSYLFSVANTGECNHLNLRRWGVYPKAGQRDCPPKHLSKSVWDQQMKYFRKRKADRLREIRNGK